MLYSFKVAQFLSFETEQILELRPHTEDGSKTESKFKAASAFIYGPNSAGKSNFLKAIIVSRYLVLGGAYKRSAQDYVRGLSAERTSSSKPSLFEYQFAIGSQEYRYGFKVKLQKTKVTFFKEHLHVKKDSEWSVIFDEQRSSEELNDPFGIDDSESLLFQYAEYHEKKTVNELCRKIHAWFLQSFIVKTPNDTDCHYDVGPDFLNELQNGLVEFQTGITGIDYSEFIKKEIPENLTKKMILGPGPHLVYIQGNERKRHWLLLRRTVNGVSEWGEIRFIHGSEQSVRIEEESLGTLELIKYLAMFSKDSAKRRNIEKILVIDEIECSLHSFAVEHLVEIAKSKRNMQIIATTHEAYLLESSAVNRDEIWFIDRKIDSKKGSVLYPLNGFKKFNAEDIQERYFDGRFYSVPHFTTPSDEE